MDTRSVILVGSWGGRWYSVSSTGERWWHKGKADAMQAAILWAYLNRPADAVVEEKKSRRMFAAS